MTVVTYLHVILGQLRFSQALMRCSCARVFPETIGRSRILNISEPFILLIMLFWLVRVFTTKQYGTKPEALNPPLDPKRASPYIAVSPQISRQGRSCAVCQKK